MRIVYRVIFCLAAATLITFAVPAMSMGQKVEPAQSDLSSPTLPVVTLDVWKNSSDKERHAFLMGFMSMLEMERAWQGENLLSVEQSTVSTWVRGISGVTISDMDAAVNDYIAKNPKDGDTSVLMVLGRLYVKPKLSQQESASAAKHYETLKASFRK